MNEMGIHNTLYNAHTKLLYSSYEGTIGHIAPNVVNRRFNAEEPFKVLHTDVTQIKLLDGTWAYVSSITDQATKEILAFIVSRSPNKKMIFDTLDMLKKNLPKDANPVLHSDQGWHYQLADYQDELKIMDCIQSMSRKGNCLDNAPEESFFHLLKIECINRVELQNIDDLKSISKKYVKWFNEDRISAKTSYLSPVDYRSKALTSLAS